MIDTHCHINDQAFRNDPFSYITEAKDYKVDKFFIIGFDIESSRIAVEIAEKYEECYALIGVHPSEITKVQDDYILVLKELAKSKKVIGIGEIGLDYYWDKDKDIQRKQRDSFIEQIELANKLRLPISIHCRDALADCLEILRGNKVKRGGIMHCYAGSYEISSEFIKLGFLLGIGGVSTFKNALKLKEVIKKISEDSYVLETDAPYLTPAPHRGDQNHSKYLYLIRDEVASLRNISPREVEIQTTANVKRVFKL